MNEKSVYEILTDENDTDNIVLCDSDGAETEFEQEATLTLNGETYAVLCPLDNGFEASNVGYVFKLDPKNCDTLQLVTDDKIVDDVFAMYEQLCNKA